MRKRPPFAAVLILAVVASASTWFFMNRILVAYQVAEAAAHNRPRGNFSDLYPRWLGARELLVNHRNPYSTEVTRKIQQGYYGRIIDSSNPDDPRDQQAFVYPVYVVFLLAPTVDLPFATVQSGFRWLLVVLVVVDVFLWLYILRWKAGVRSTLFFIVLTLGWIPVVQGLKLQQLTLLVTALLGACGACLVAGWLGMAGVFLALSTIKPQLTWPIVLWLLIWAASDWRKRHRFFFGFGIVSVLLLAGAQFVLPGWVGMFVDGIRRYREYTRGEALLTILLGSIAGGVLQLVALAATAACVWRLRREPADSESFGRSFALVLSLALILLPMSALYNQVLLAPAILALARSACAQDFGDQVGGSARIVGGLLFVWPWVATVGLSLAYIWITPELRRHIVQLPFYASIGMPVFIFGLALLDTWTSREAVNHAAGLRDAERAE